KVEDHQLVVGRERLLEPGLTVTRILDEITRGRERAGNEAPDVRLVIDNQNPGAGSRRLTFVAAHCLFSRQVRSDDARTLAAASSRVPRKHRSTGQDLLHERGHGQLVAIRSKLFYYVPAPAKSAPISASQIG